jgi:hypothetical protein
MLTDTLFFSKKATICYASCTQLRSRWQFVIFFEEKNQKCARPKIASFGEIAVKAVY